MWGEIYSKYLEVGTTSAYIESKYLLAHLKSNTL